MPADAVRGSHQRDSFQICGLRTPHSRWLKPRVCCVVDCPAARCPGGDGVPQSNIRGYTFVMSKVMVSLPQELLAELDDEAKRRSTSRSALLATAARRELDRRDGEQVAAAITRSEHRFAGAGAFEAADLVRHERDSRR